MKKKPHTVVFIGLMCIISSLILATLTDILTPYQEQKKEAYTKREILRCVQISSEGSAKQILERFNINLTAKLVDNKGEIYTFEELKIHEKQYLEKYSKIGFYKAPYKLFYQKNDHTGFVIPIDGFGLWGPIHGFLALEKDGITIQGLTFYDHMETPGLGAEISNNEWQRQFVGKSIHPSSEPLQVQSPPFSIYVVKNAQKMALDLQAQLNSVDAITGASVTSNGVQKAFELCLKAYRPLILKKNRAYEETK
jgi:Na+-transporting NADH:ubiquinone oxidoreductase subunit C